MKSNFTRVNKFTLRKLCSALSLSVTGDKSDLVNAIEKHLSGITGSAAAGSSGGAGAGSYEDEGSSAAAAAAGSGDDEGEDGKDSDKDSEEGDDDKDVDPTTPGEEKDGYEIFIRLPNAVLHTFTVDVIDTIHDVKLQVQGKCGIRRKDQRLFLAGAELEDHHTLMKYDVYVDSELMLLIRGLGGGKRGRSDAGGETGVAVLKNAIGMKLMALGANRSEELQSIRGIMLQTSAIVDRSPGNCVTSALADLTEKELRSLQAGLMRATRTDARSGAFSNIAFVQAHERISFLTEQIKVASGVLLDMSMLMVHSEFGHEGQISWENMHTAITDAIIAKA